MSAFLRGQVEPGEMSELGDGIQIQRHGDLVRQKLAETNTEASIRAISAFPRGIRLEG
jgi:hypothetical protein